MSVKRDRALLSLEQLGDRVVPAIVSYALDTTADTAFDHFDNIMKMAPVDAGGKVSLRAVIDFASGMPETGNWNMNHYEVNFSGIAGQTITLDPNLGTLELKSNFNFLGSSATVERNVGQAAFGLFDVDVSMDTRFLNLTLQGGKAPDSGGAILAHRDAELHLQFCTLMNNEAVKEGGAIAANRSALDDGPGLAGARIFISNCLLGLNRATVAGGAISVNGAANLTISGSSIAGNDVTGVGLDEGFGGGVYAVTTLTSISYTNITGNDATKDGGGLYVLDCNLTMNNGQINGNTSGRDGGGLYINADGMTVTLNNVRVTQNSAANKGGGAYVFNGTLAGSLTELTGNTATVAIPGIAYKQANGAAVTATVPMFQQTVVAD